MFNDIIRALTGAEPARLAKGPDGLRLAVAVLLVTAAQADDVFAPGERSTIETLLAQRFGLSHEEVERLMRQAEHQADASLGMFRFVQSVVEQSPPAERVWLIEMLWEVAYADGHLSPDEDALIRRVAGIVHVTDVERGTARQRVIERLKANRA